MSELIDLSAAEKLGSGNERICYVHPLDSSKCIKIYHPMEEIMKHTRVVRQQNEMEYAYFSRLEQRNIPFTHLPRCFGWVETSLGRGLVLERVVNADGSQSQSIDKWVQSGRLSKERAKQVLLDIENYLLEHGIAICDISPDHVVLKEDSAGFTAKIIDGVGSRYNDWKLWLISYIPLFARRKTKKIWPVMIQKVMNLTTN